MHFNADLFRQAGRRHPGDDRAHDRPRHRLHAGDHRDRAARSSRPGQRLAHHGRRQGRRLEPARPVVHHAKGAALPQWFQSRPSAAGNGYDGGASSGSNYGPNSKALIALITARADGHREVGRRHAGADPRGCRDRIRHQGSTPTSAPPTRCCRSIASRKRADSPLPMVKKLVESKIQGPGARLPRRSDSQRAGTEHRAGPARLTLAPPGKQDARMSRGRLRVMLGAAPGVGKTFAMLEEGRRLREPRARTSSSRSSRPTAARPQPRCSTGSRCCPGARSPTAASRSTRWTWRRLRPDARTSRWSTNSPTPTRPARRTRSAGRMWMPSSRPASTCSRRSTCSTSSRSTTWCARSPEFRSVKRSRTRCCGEPTRSNSSTSRPRRFAIGCPRVSSIRRRAWTRRSATTSGSATSRRCASWRCCGSPTRWMSRCRRTGSRRASTRRGRRASESSSRSPAVRRARRCFAAAHESRLGPAAVSSWPCTSPARTASSEGNPAELDAQRALIETLGGSYHHVVADQIPVALVEFARSVNATQLVIGVSRRSRFESIVGGAGIGASVIRLAGDIDVHIVPHAQAGKRRLPTIGGALSLRRRIAGVGAHRRRPAADDLAAHRSSAPRATLSTEVLAYQLFVVVVALVGGIWPALLAAVGAGFFLDFFFEPPLYVIRIAEPSHFVVADHLSGGRGARQPRRRPGRTAPACREPFGRRIRGARGRRQRGHRRHRCHRGARRPPARGVRDDERRAR